MSWKDRLGVCLGLAGFALSATLPFLLRESWAGNAPPAPLFFLPQDAPGSTSRSAQFDDTSLRSADDVVRVASYTLEAKLDPEAHVVQGSGTIRLLNVSSAPLDHVFVHLYLNAFEHERTVFRRRAGSGMRGSDQLTSAGHIDVERFAWVEAGQENLWPAGATTPGDPEDRTDIRVPLPRSILPGETATFELRFQSYLPSIALRTGFLGSFHMVAQWFPKLAKLEKKGFFAHFPFERFSEFYSDFGDYDVTVDVPEAFEVGGAGNIVEDQTADGRRRVRFSESAIGDFSFTAWDGFDVREATASGVKLRCLFPKGQDASARIELDATARGLAYFNEALGVYPYDHLTIVHPPEGADEAGGMEYPTLITTGGSAWAAYVPARLLEGLTLHELAHQWFYGLVATNENAHPFLDEGLTTYVSERALRDLYGPFGLVDYLPVDITIDELERSFQLGMHGRAPVSSRAGDFASGSDYGRLVYARTATILRTLDRVWDGAALRATGAYAREHRFRHPSPTELERAIAEASNEEAVRFFRSATFAQGHVDFRPTAIENEARAGGGFIRRVWLERAGDLSIPVDLDLIDSSGARQRVRWSGDEATTVVSTEGSLPLHSVLVDPEHRVLVDEDRHNDALSIDPSSLAPRSFLLSELVTALILHGLTP